MKSALFALALLAQDPAISTSETAPLPEVRTTRIDRVFAHLDRTDAPGCAVGVVVAGELVHARGYGMANLEHGLALSADSVFRIGSTSKQFTAACLLLAEQDGALSLDDRLLDHVPELGATYADVTLRHMVHHQSGIRDYLTLAWLADLGAGYDLDELVALLARQEGLDFAPGEGMSYSNSGYVLLSLVLQRATGKDLRTFGDERVFGPLGMERTFFNDDHTELVPRRAEGHEFDPSHGWRIGRTTLDVVGDGGVFSTVGDLALWDANFYDHGVGGATLHARSSQGGGEIGKRERREGAIINESETRRRRHQAAGVVANRGAPPLPPPPTTTTSSDASLRLVTAQTACFTISNDVASSLP